MKRSNPSTNMVRFEADGGSRRRGRPVRGLVAARSAASWLAGATKPFSLAELQAEGRRDTRGTWGRPSGSLRSTRPASARRCARPGSRWCGGDCADRARDDRAVGDKEAGVPRRRSRRTYRRPRRRRSPRRSRRRRPWDSRRRGCTVTEVSAQELVQRGCARSAAQRLDAAVHSHRLIAPKRPVLDFRPHDLTLPGDRGPGVHRRRRSPCPGTTME